MSQVEQLRRLKIDVQVLHQDLNIAQNKISEKHSDIQAQKRRLRTYRHHIQDQQTIIKGKDDEMRKMEEKFRQMKDQVDILTTKSSVLEWS